MLAWMNGPESPAIATFPVGTVPGGASAAGAAAGGCAAVLGTGAADVAGGGGAGGARADAVLGPPLFCAASQSLRSSLAIFDAIFQPVALMMFFGRSLSLKMHFAPLE